MAEKKKPAPKLWQKGWIKERLQDLFAQFMLDLIEALEEPGNAKIEALKDKLRKELND